MSWFTWLYPLYCIIHISLHHINSQQFIQSALLKPSSISTLSGISVSMSPSVRIINDKWSVNVATQQGSDLAISMDNRWGFHPLYPSSLQLHITGNTSNQTVRDDGELLFIFSVENEYFTEMVSLDNRKTAYKECPISRSNLLIRDMDEMINSIAPDRYHRFCNNSVRTTQNNVIDYWHSVGSTKLPAQWPMFISIANNPLLNIIQYSWTDRSNALNRVSSQYTSSFATQQGINIYISGDDKYEAFYIFSIDVSYRYTIPTSTKSPSTNPSNLPSAAPSKSPSIFPTYSPSKLATFSPTLLAQTSTVPTAAAAATTLPPSLSPSYSIITEIIRHNSTVVPVVMDSESAARMSWFQSFVIILSVFVFLTGWLAFFGFVYFTKHKKKARCQKESDVVVSVREGMDMHMNAYDGNLDAITVSDKGSYKSESALIADESNRNANASASGSRSTSEVSVDGSSSTSQPIACEKQKEDNVPMLNAIAIINNDIHNPMDSPVLQSETGTNDSETDTDTETNSNTNTSESFMYEPGNNGYAFHGFHLQHSIRQQQLYKNKAAANYSANMN